VRLETSDIDFEEQQLGSSYMISPEQREVALKTFKKKGILPHPTSLHLQNLIFKKIKDENLNDNWKLNCKTVTKSLENARIINKTSLESRL